MKGEMTLPANDTYTSVSTIITENPNGANVVGPAIVSVVPPTPGGAKGTFHVTFTTDKKGGYQGRALMSYMVGGAIPQAKFDDKTLEIE